MSQAVCDSFILECLQGIHVLPTDVLKLALYDSTASLGFGTTAYNASHEVIGAGYAAGGVVLPVAPGFPRILNRIVQLSFSNVLINPATFATRLGLVYNFSKANRAVGVIDFGAILNAVASFTVTWPDPNQNPATFQWSAAK